VLETIEIPVTLLLWIGYISLYSDLRFSYPTDEDLSPSSVPGQVKPANMDSFRHRTGSHKLPFQAKVQNTEGKVGRFLQSINAANNETSTNYSAIVPSRNRTNETLKSEIQISSNKTKAPWETMAIVYTWVNGSDPEYQKLRTKYGGPGHVGGSRDRDSDELKHSLRSLETMVPMFKGPIYLVTPGHIPNWLNLSNPRIHVINQDSLLPPEATPSFSSFPIEFNLWRIPNMTDIFMYLNDDYMFGRQIKPSDLFSSKGYPKLFFEHHSHIVNGSEFHDKKRIFVSALSHTNGALNEAYGKVPRKFIKHAPYLFYRQVCQNLFTKFGSYVNATLQHKFRSTRDVLLTMLHHYYVMNEGPSQGFNYVKIDGKKYEPDMVLYHIVDKDENLQKEFNRARKDRPKFFAVNDVFDKPETALKLKAFLDEFYPNASSFEKINTSTL